MAEHDMDSGELEAAAFDPNDALTAMLPAGWEHDGFGFDALLICPHGNTIEMDGQCPEGCVSPLRDMGMI